MLYPRGQSVATLPDIREGRVDGIPAFSAAVSEPDHCALTFRVGWSDETLIGRGITHLVEHLAAGLGDTGYQYNAFVDVSRTSFVAQGTGPQLSDFVVRVCRALRRLPVDRIADEVRVLETEAAGRGSTPLADLLRARFGAQTQGLSAYREFGLPRVTAESAQMWSDHWFCAENAALWTTVDLGDLELGLHRGQRREPVPVQPLPLEFPLWVERIGWVGGGMIVSRSTAAISALEILRRRLFRELRENRGLVYQVNAHYQPLSKDHAHLMVAADVLPENAIDAQEALIEQVAMLRASGPDEAELRALVDLRAQLPTRQATLGALERSAMNALWGRDPEQEGDLQAEQESLTADEVRSAFNAGWESMILAVRDGSRVGIEHARPYPDSTPGPRVEGKEGRSSRVGAHAFGTKLIVAEEGISRMEPRVTITARFQECAAVLWWYDGRRSLIAANGWSLMVDPRLWDNGYMAVETIDRNVPADMFFAMEQPPPTPMPTRTSNRAGRAHQVLFVLGAILAALGLFGVAEQLIAHDYADYVGGAIASAIAGVLPGLVLISIAAWSLYSRRRATRQIAGAAERSAAQSFPEVVKTTPEELHCQACGAMPAEVFKLQSTTGAILVSVNLVQTSVLCRDCGLSEFRRVTNSTLWSGWWSITGFVKNLVVIGANVRERGRILSLAAPHDRLPEREPLAAGKPLIRRGGVFVPVFLLAFIVGFFWLIAVTQPHA